MIQSENVIKIIRYRFMSTIRNQYCNFWFIQKVFFNNTTNVLIFTILVGCEKLQKSQYLNSIFLLNYTRYCIKKGFDLKLFTTKRSKTQAEIYNRRSTAPALPADFQRWHSAGSRSSWSLSRYWQSFER